MHDAEEQDTCRICSAPAEPDQPLFHPCKCSGTIRYIHQDCLTTWLAHSKKKTCDVCKHPYAFTKVYAPDMPSHIPPLLLVRRLIQQLLFGILFVLRAIVVAIIWLAFLPWVTVWTWRMYFAMGESTAWWISNRPRPQQQNDTSLSFFPKVRYERFPLLAPLSSPPTDALSARIGTFAERIISHPAWVSISADIFTGQIIAALIVLTFVAIFLLREWISQNARPGLFEDDELPLDDPANLPPPPLADPAFVAPRQDPPDIPGFPEEELAQRQQHAMRVMDAFRLQANANQPQAPPGTVQDDWMDVDVDEVYYDAKGKQRDDGEPTKRPRQGKRAREEREDSASTSNALRAEARRYTANGKALTRRKHQRSSSAPPVQPPPPPPPQGGPERPTFQFTFRASADGVRDNQVGEPSFFPPVQLQPPREDIPFAIRGWKPSPPSSEAVLPASPNLSPVAGPSLIAPSSLSLALESPSSSKSPQRPPLASSISSPPLLSLAEMLSTAPVASPSPPLATYRPPEEMFIEGWSPTLPDDYFSTPKPSTSVASSSTSHNPPSPADSSMWSTASTGGLTKDAEEVEEPSSGDSDDSRSYMFRPLPETWPPQGDEVHPRKSSNDRESISDSDETETEGEEDEATAFLKRSAASRRRAYGVVNDDPHRGDEGHWQDEEDEDEEEEDMEAQARLYFFDDNNELREEPGRLILPQHGPLRLDEMMDIQDGDGENEGQNAGDGGNQPALNGDMQDGAALDVNDDLDGNVEDDMEGAMEAIGMRGPIYGVLQNAALMVFVLDTAIGLCIWIPFTVGKTTALLSLDPARMLQILHLPIKVMRLVTDPIVDSAVYIIMQILLPPILNILTVVLGLVGTIASIFLPGSSKPSLEDAAPVASLYDQSMDFLNNTLSKLPYFSYLSAHHLEASPPTPPSEFLFPPYARPLEPYFEVLGRNVRTSATTVQDSWIRLALGSGPVEKVFATSLGYMMFGLFLAIYLNLLTVGNAKTAGRAVRNAVRQQLLVLKVAAFIVIELVCFPLACGVVLDIATVWLFPEANLQSRFAFFGQAPLTAMFSHWVAGTMFMYSFAILLSGCRSVIRPGAMWFIKDPQDQNSHPIRDILERPTLQQLRKISVSALMYAAVVFCFVGSVAGLLLLGSKSIMPFRWKNREPLSNVPLDLLFLHLVLPQTLHYFRPRRGLKSLATKVWRVFAAELRLTSYFFGGRYPTEEYPTSAWFKLPWTNIVITDEKGERKVDGTFRRVPATDNIALPRDMKATAAVNPDGTPVDEEAARLLLQQNTEAIKAKHDVDKDYTIVFIPTGFRYRIIAFIALMWTVGALFLGISVALPIQLGRSFFTLFTTREVHDGYSFIVGFYCLWACWLGGKAIDRLEREQRRIREAQADGEPRRDVRIMAIKRCLFWVSKIAYAGLFLGIVVPILFALVMDLYIVLPIRTAFNPGVVPRIKVVDSWALGLMYGKIALHVIQLQPGNNLARNVQRLIDNGWMALDPISATKEVIAPLIGGFLGMILFPAFILQVLRLVFPRTIVHTNVMFMNIYPAIFVVAALMRITFSLYKLLMTWSQTIRDKEFLIELRLKNHEPEAAATHPSASSTPSATTAPPTNQAGPQRPPPPLGYDAPQPSTSQARPTPKSLEDELRPPSSLSNPFASERAASVVQADLDASSPEASSSRSQL